MQVGEATSHTGVRLHSGVSWGGECERRATGGVGKRKACVGDGTHAYSLHLSASCAAARPLCGVAAGVVTAGIMLFAASLGFIRVSGFVRVGCLRWVMRLVGPAPSSRGLCVPVALLDQPGHCFVGRLQQVARVKLGRASMGGSGTAPAGPPFPCQLFHTACVCVAASALHTHLACVALSGILARIFTSHFLALLLERFFFTTVP